MSEPDRDKLKQLFGGMAEFKAEEPVISDHDWVAEQLEPVAGDRIVANLDEPEVTAFVEMTMLDLELEDVQSTIRQRVAEQQMQAFAASATWQDYANRFQQFSLFNDEAEAEEAWRTYVEAEFQKARFWRDIRAKYDVWGDELAVRHGFVLVTLGKKYRL